MRLPEWYSRPHDADLVVGSLIPSGDFHFKGICLSAQRKFDGYFCAYLWFYAKLGKGKVGGGNLIRLFWGGAVAWAAEVQFRLHVVEYAEFNVVSAGIGKVCNRHPKTVVPDKVRVLKHLKLLGRHVAEIPVGFAHFHHLLRQRQGILCSFSDCCYRGKQYGCQHDCQHRCNIADFAGGKAADGQCFK